MPDGETAAEVGRRADRVVERARSVDGDTLAVAHGHFLRVLAARWLGLPPVAGRLFRLDAAAVCLLAEEHDLPAVHMWNLRAVPPRLGRTAGSGAAKTQTAADVATLPWARSTMSARL